MTKTRRRPFEAGGAFAYPEAGQGRVPLFPIPCSLFPLPQEQIEAPGHVSIVWQLHTV